MMKFFVNARFLTQPVSGVQRYGIECSTQIKKINPNVMFVAPANIIHKDIARALDVQVTGTHTGHLWEQKDLPAFMKKNGGQPLLNLANTAPLFYNNNFTTIHDLAFYHHPEWNSRPFSLWYNFLMPRLAKRSRHIFTVSQAMQDEIIKYYHVPPGKISVTYNGLSANILRQNRAACRNKDKVILSVGSFNARKNHHYLVKAFIASELKQQYRLIIIGDKNRVFRETELDEQAIKDNNIEIHQGMTDKALAAMYCKAEVVVSLSAYEGFGIPVLEGLYFGSKVLCSDIPVYRELYDKYAWFCNPYDINDVRLALEKVVAAGNIVSGNEMSLLTASYNYERAAHTILEHIYANTPHSAA